MSRKHHIVDSGAHSLLNAMLKKAKKTKKLDYSFYDSKEFWAYVDKYANFIKENIRSIDHYINVDAIRNPKKSWEIQKYLENEHGLNPIPVIHFNTSMKWIERHLNYGYKYIGLGGQVGRLDYFQWADQAWNLICSTPKNLPACKVHGFAVTTHKHMTRYPWYSVDSVTSKKMAYYGQVLTPPCVQGKFRFDIPNNVLFMDEQSKYSVKSESGRGRHFLHLSWDEQKATREWFEAIDVPFGERRKGKIIKPGVTNNIGIRVQATIKYFLNVQRRQPKWPWSFQNHERYLLLED